MTSIDIMVARFLHRFRRLSISKVNFSMLTKSWAPISYQKILHFQENG